MATSKAKTVTEYLASLPKERREEIAAVRAHVKQHLPSGFVEGMQYGMITWFVPLSRFPDTYNRLPLAIASLASQKNYNALYLMGAYMNPTATARLNAECKAKGQKLDMGKSCLRFAAVDELPLNAIGEILEEATVDWLIGQHEAVHAKKRKSRKAAKGVTRRKPARAKRTRR